MKRWKLYSISLLALILCTPFSYIYLTQERELFKPVPLSNDHKFSFEFPYEEITLTPEEGVKLHALYTPAKNAKGVLVYYKGRGGNLEFPWGETTLDFTSRGYDVLMMDYRSSGKSRGKLSYEAILSDAELIYSYAKERFGEERLAIYGSSLGTGIATYIAARHNPQMLLLESPYYSLLDSACNTKEWIPPALVKVILKYPFPTNHWIQSVRCPVHIFHGVEDEVIAYDSSLRLLDLVKGRLETSLTTIEGYAHRHIYLSDEYKNHLTEVLK
ncbi:MAG: alpha/beta hydrolase [Candidatus Algichlamydia australiensis]|nr:alpha/beta hydrolase [Chlamydiales bacterium]